MNVLKIRVVTAVLLCAGSLEAQDAATVRENNIGPAFFNVRYASARASLIYAGYRVQPALVFVGFVQNPRTDYRELILGLGTTFGSARRNVLVGVATASASDSRYVQLYILPTLTFGRLEGNATIEAYEPLERTGVAQVSASPANLYWLASRRGAVGLTYVGAGQRNLPPSHAAGPSLRANIPRGTVSFDVIRGLRDAPNEVRVTLYSRF